MRSSFTAGGFFCPAELWRLVSAAGEEADIVELLASLDEKYETDLRLIYAERPESLEALAKNFPNLDVVLKWCNA